MNEAKLWFWVLLDAAIAVAVVVFVLGGVPLMSRYGAALAPARTVTVTAEGQTTAAPDLAELTFSVVSRGADPNALSDENSQKMNAVDEFLAGQHVASSDIQTINYNLQPNYNYDDHGNQIGVNGYTLTNTLQVKIHDLTSTAAIIGGLAPLGVNQVSGVNFTFEDQDKYIAPARAEALQKAQEKAQQMASAMGASIGTVVTMSENVGWPGPRPVYYATGMGAGMKDAAMSVPVIQPGSQNITDDVTVTYSLR